MQHIHIRRRASSILQRNAKMYGPSHALDSRSSACWNSEGLTSSSATTPHHWFRLDFGRVVHLHAVAVQFQAGFVAQTGRIEALMKDGSEESSPWEILEDAAEWKDVHELQRLDLPATAVDLGVVALRLVLEDCTDFYGRVILYQVQVWGQEHYKEADDENTNAPGETFQG